MTTFFGGYTKDFFEKKDEIQTFLISQSHWSHK